MDSFHNGQVAPGTDCVIRDLEFQPMSNLLRKGEKLEIKKKKKSLVANYLIYHVYIVKLLLKTLPKGFGVLQGW